MIQHNPDRNPSYGRMNRGELHELMAGFLSEPVRERYEAIATLLRYLNRAETRYIQKLVRGIERHSPELVQE